MARWAKVEEGEPPIEVRHDQALVIGDVTYARDVLFNVEHLRAGFDEAWANSVGVYKIVPQQVPEGKVVVARNFEFDGVSSVYEVLTLQDQGLDARKMALRTAVSAKRDAVIESGFVFDGVLYQSRDRDQLRIAATAQLAAAYIAQGQNLSSLRWADANNDFTWIAADNTKVLMTAPQMYSFALAAMVFVRSCVYVGDAKKTAIGAATTHEELAAVDINSGWPQ